MKTRILYLFLVVFLFAGELSAQSQCAKGHFIFGSDLFQYSAGTSTIKSYTGSNSTPQDTFKNSFSTLTYGINIWAGYFVSKKVCVGLSYDFQQSPLEYYYGLYYYDYYQPLSIFPSNLFFRYYIVGADSGGIFDLAVEGNFGFEYSNVSNTVSPEYTGNRYSTTEVDDFTNINTGVNLLASLHISKHFALQLMGGMKISYESIDVASITTNPPTPGSNFTPSKDSYFTDMFTGSFRLQFYL